MVKRAARRNQDSIPRQNEVHRQVIEMPRQSGLIQVGTPFYPTMSIRPDTCRPSRYVVGQLSRSLPKETFGPSRYLLSQADGSIVVGTLAVILLKSLCQNCFLRLTR
jgi:hypothetical protein